MKKFVRGIRSSVIILIKIEKKIWKFAGLFRFISITIAVICNYLTADRIYCSGPAISMLITMLVVKAVATAVIVLAPICYTIAALV